MSMCEYTVHALAALSGVSERTLRYYDAIGLLKPARIESNGYRVYGREQVDMLQQILLYREMEMPLAEIGALLHAPDFDRQEALKAHLMTLHRRRERLDRLLATVQKSIQALEEGDTMQDKEKFEGFKDALIAQNEATYGKEARARYGDEAVDAANAKLKGMSEKGYHDAEALRLAVNDALKAAMQTGDPAGEEAQKLCKLHRDWLCTQWKDGMYTKEAHCGMGEMYAADERFRKYYDDACGAGAAEFLRDALNRCLR